LDCSLDPLNEEALRHIHIFHFEKISLHLIAWIDLAFDNLRRTFAIQHSKTFEDQDYLNQISKGGCFQKIEERKEKEPTLPSGKLRAKLVEVYLIKSLI